MRNFRPFFFPLLVALALGIFSRPARADVLQAFNLNDITGGQAESGTQFQTGLSIRYSANLTGWDASGFHAIHALQIDSNNWALMVFSGGSPSDPNVYTLSTGFSANDLGIQYWVSYDIAPTVYVDGGQATRDTDFLRISLLNPSSQVVAFNDVAPGAWMGSQAFHQAYFSYIGDGTGDVRLQITTANPGSGFFAGAVDNIAFENSQPVPEPGTYLLLGVGGLLITQAYRRRSPN